VKESLENRGFEVRHVTDGKEAISVYNTFLPDLCILDVMLPNRNGFSIAQDIHRDNPDLPIIFLTAKDQTPDILKGFSSGGNDYIKKPFSLEELIVRVENLLKLAGEKVNNQSEIIIGKYIFNPLQFELVFKDEVRSLSHRESELLKILINDRNTPVMRKKILQAIWGDDSFFNSRNLDVYITRLRNYLKDDPNVRIVTLKGVGYQFIA
jgi:DNA-binding response OmpR family regulator